LWFRSDIESIYLEKSQLFTNYYFWLIPLGIAYVFYLVLEVYLRSLMKNIVSVFAMELVLRLAVTCILFLLWFKCITFDDFVVLHSLVYFIPVIILLVYMYRIDELHLGLSNFNISKKFRKIIFQFSAFNYINTLVSTLVISLDVIMIASYLGLQATGVYTTVVFLTSALQVPYKAIVRISSPLIADHWKKREMEKMKELYTQVSSVALVIGLGSFLLIWSNIDFLFSFLKPEFKAGIWVFFFLMIGRLTDMYFGLNGAIFTTSKKYKYDMIFTLFLIGTVYGLNLLFIPAYGISGAAISTSIALVCYNLGRLLFVYKVYKIHPFTKGQFVILALGLLTFFLCHYLQNIFQDLWIQMLFMSSFVAILFFGSIYFFKLEKETVNYVNNSMDFLIKKIRRKN
jgi:O-antigen/teichoic acid export membrane protein